MIYQLPNGKVIEISTEQYLEISDEELEYLVAFNYGAMLEDPWFGSVLSKFVHESDDILDDSLTELTQIPDQEKMMDLDIEYYPEEE